MCVFLHTVVYLQINGINIMRQHSVNSMETHISGLQPSGLVFLWPMEMWYTTSSERSRFGYGRVPVVKQRSLHFCFHCPQPVTRKEVLWDFSWDSHSKTLNELRWERIFGSSLDYDQDLIDIKLHFDWPRVQTDSAHTAESKPDGQPQTQLGLTYWGLVHGFRVKIRRSSVIEK